MHNIIYFLTKIKKNLAFLLLKFIKGDRTKKINLVNLPFIARGHFVLKFTATAEIHNLSERLYDLLPEDVSGGEEALGDEHRIPSVPLLTLKLDQ